jgi:hypothetical protein
MHNERIEEYANKQNEINKPKDGAGYENKQRKVDV